MKKFKEKSFTLIEMLFAISLFSLIVLFISYIFSQSLGYYRDIRERVEPLSQISKYLWLHKSIASVLDYYVKDENWYPFFIGERYLMSYVSSSGLFTELPVLVILIVEKETEKKKRLVYYELPVYTLSGKELEEIIKNRFYLKGMRVILVKEAREINFEYFGSALAYKTPFWQEGYSGRKENKLPYFIKINIKDNFLNFYYIFSIKNNSYIKYFYNEIYR